MREEVYMAHSAKRKVQRHIPPWRKEKVFIVPHGQGFQVVPPYKVVSKGQTVTFRAFDCKSLKIGKLNSRAFDDPEPTHDPTVFTVHVKAHAPAGFYPYSVVCGTVEKKNARPKIEARGASSPGMIVDP
jgi:hypothetical protein